MAKRKSDETVTENNKALGEVIESLNDNLETSKNKEAVAKEKRTSSIELRNPEDKLILRKKNGKPMVLTIDEALKDKNFRLLSAASQKALTAGKSASQIVREQD